MNRIELVRNEIDALLFNQNDKEIRRNGYFHLYGVAQCCSILAIRRGLNIELCTIAGLLHDIYSYKFGYVKEHAALGTFEAETVLIDLNIFTNAEIEIIKNMISNHSDKKHKHDKYSELLKDADLFHTSLYNLSFEAKHKERIKKIFKDLKIKRKLKKVPKKKNTKPEFLNQDNPIG